MISWKWWLTYCCRSEGNQLNVTVSPSPEQPPATDGPVQQSSPPSPVYNPPLHHKIKTIDTKAIAYVVAIGSSIIIAIAILLVKICIPTWKEKQNASFKRVEVIMHERSKEPDSSNNTTQSILNNQGIGLFWSWFFIENFIIYYSLTFKISFTYTVSCN